MNHIEIVYNVDRNCYHRAWVPVDYRRGTFPIRDIMSPMDMAKLARLTNRL